MQGKMTLLNQKHDNYQEKKSLVNFEIQLKYNALKMNVFYLFKTILLTRLNMKIQTITKIETTIASVS